MCAPDKAANKPAAPKFLLLLLSNMLEMTALSLILPSYPKLCGELGIDNKRRSFILSVYSLFQFLSSPILGRCSDAYGRVTFLRLSALASIGCYTGMLLANDRWTMSLARTLPGLLKCGIAVSQAYVVDISNEKDRARNLGTLGATYGLAFVFGPAIGGMLMKRNLWLATKVALVATLLNLAVLIFLLPEPARSTARKSHEKVEEDSRVSGSASEPDTCKAETGGVSNGSKAGVWRHLLDSPKGGRVLALLLQKLASSLAYCMFESNIAEYFLRHLRVQGPTLGLLFSFLGMLSVFYNAVLVRLLTRAFRADQIMLFAVVLQALALWTWGHVGSLQALLPVIAVLSLSASAFASMTSSEVRKAAYHVRRSQIHYIGMGKWAMHLQLSKATPQELMGTVLGLSWACETMARIIAAPLGSFLLEGVGVQGLSWAGVSALTPCVANVALDFSRRRAEKVESTRARKAETVGTVGTESRENAGRTKKTQ